MKKKNLAGLLFLFLLSFLAAFILFSLIGISQEVNTVYNAIKYDRRNDESEDCEISIKGTYRFRIFPWLYKDEFRGEIMIVDADNSRNTYTMTFSDSYGLLLDWSGASKDGWYGSYTAIKNIERGIIIPFDAEYIYVFPAQTLDEATNILRENMMLFEK